MFLGDSLSTVEVFNPLTEKWELAENMSILRSRVGVAVLNNKLYAFGGYNGVERLSSVEVFDPTTKSWNIVSPMHRKRRYFFFPSSFTLPFFLIYYFVLLYDL